MFHLIEKVFNDQEIAQLNQLASRAQFVDGRVTNSGSKVKNNLQIPQEDPINDQAAELVRNGLIRHPDVHHYVSPRRATRATFSRYEPGMEYGDHVDAPLMTVQPPLRADVSCTVFLSSPDSYQGGELVARSGNRELVVKGNPGDVVLYPSNTIHRVNPVNEGVRLVAVLWFESHVRDPQQRDILFNLQAIMDDPRVHAAGDDLATSVAWVRSNLMRMWADT